MLTKRGIELNINESKYIFVVDNLMLYFSSNFNKERFISNYNSYIDEETIKLENRYKINIDIKNLLVISFYKKIEKRGFYIVDINSKHEIKENAIFKTYIK